MYTYIKNIGLLATLLSFCLISCSDDYPHSKVEELPTDLFSIKIVNAGAEGNMVFEGTIDETTKTINFPRLELGTNFSALKVEAEVSEGAKLQQSTLDFSMDDETASKTLILRVINNKRYQDYFIRIRKKVPVFGADFEKPTVYNFSGDNLYPDFVSLNTRCASFDGEHVLVVSRMGGSGPHLLKVSDLKKGEIKPMMLDLTNVTGGTFTYNTGALANSHVYLSSLSGGHASPLKIYYWETPKSTPEVIANINVGNIPGAGVRHGDNISVNIDKNGNGFIYYGDNASASILRLTVTNHKTIDSPAVLPSSSNATGFMNVYRIEDTGQYLWAGVRQAITLTDESLSAKYTMKKENIAAEAISPRIFSFNSERYLMVCTAGLGGASQATPSVHVYNITKGNNAEEALKLFDDGPNHNPDYTFILGGTGNAAPGAQAEYYIEKDEDGKDVKLYIFGARADSGFVISEFPIKQEDDE